MKTFFRGFNADLHSGSHKAAVLKNWHFDVPDMGGFEYWYLYATVVKTYDYWFDNFTEFTLKLPLSSGILVFYKCVIKEFDFPGIIIKGQGGPLNE